MYRYELSQKWLYVSFTLRSFHLRCTLDGRFNVPHNRYDQNGGAMGNVCTARSQALHRLSYPCFFLICERQKSSDESKANVKVDVNMSLC
jgi:hypothetical protein